MSISVTENPAAERYEIHVDGELAGFSEYRGGGERRAFTHTEIDPEFEGRGLGRQLVAGALDAARESGHTIVPMCPFVLKFITKNPEYVDLVAPEHRAAFNLPAAPSS